jgi:dinuclear metal center YbgI/SA1388 family protein
MHTVAHIAEFLDKFAPPALAESWDNVGLLVGRFEQPVERVMTCLTITPESAAEAVANRANLIVSHHPLPFRPLKRLTGETSEGRLLLDLIAAGIAVYSPHTAFDSAEEGINQRLAAGLQLTDVLPLVPGAEPWQGAGRHGRLQHAITLRELARRVKQLLALENVQAVGALDQPLDSVAVACGSAGEFLEPAQTAGCNCLVTGEVRFHTCLDAEARGMSLVLAGHFASERFAVVELADVLAQHFPALQVWASKQERDPLHWL